ncbi:hypothetical protein ASG56_14730 [Rhodococcus sp. Leaf7]|nr:hypothetical protein ASG56_14730 [Rhodococcus sp. Leaf7]KQU40763.1 hypothetical protein ASG64_14720 [Rhodococcus sp. Leaf247]
MTVNDPADVDDFADPDDLADSDASTYPAHLDATVEALRAHGADHDARADIPLDVSDRIVAALNAAPLVATDQLAARRSRSRRHVTAFAAAVAVVALGSGVGLAVAAQSNPGSNDTVVSAAPPLDDATVFSLVGSTDRGRLSDPELLAGCLEANGLPETTSLVGSGTVSVDGTDATLLIVGGGRPGSLIALAVGPSCGPGNADTVSRARIG